jgi:hypothetical protein
MTDSATTLDPLKASIAQFTRERELAVRDPAVDHVTLVHEFPGRAADSIKPCLHHSGIRIRVRAGEVDHPSTLERDSEWSRLRTAAYKR